MPGARANKRPFIIPLFIPHAGCPHQCVFCNQRTITGAQKSIPTPQSLHERINSFLSFKNAECRPVQIAFFGGNFLGLRANEILRLLKLANQYVQAGDVDGLRFSTRPDTIDSAKLALIADYPVATIELGVQSMDDDVLVLSKRGHTAQDTFRAVALLKQHNYELGLQMMVGLPGDDEIKSLATALGMAELEPDFVRIYPTVVIAGSPLAAMYANGSYSPLSVQEAVSTVKKLYLLFKARDIRVVRMGLQASGETDQEAAFLAGPFHPAFGHLVHSAIFLDMAADAVIENDLAGTNVTVTVHPRAIPKLRGLKNHNLMILKQRFALQEVIVRGDAAMAPDRVEVQEGLP